MFGTQQLAQRATHHCGGELQSTHAARYKFNEKKMVFFSSMEKEIGITSAEEQLNQEKKCL